jgi:hypothetical protein
MSAELFKTFGQIAGIGGLALAVFLVLFRDVIRRNIFSTLPPATTFRLMRHIIWAVWSIAALGLLIWFLGSGLVIGDNNLIFTWWR